MRNFKKLAIACAAAALLLGSAAQSQAAFVYVGSWDLGTLGGGYANASNPYLWYTNPAVYNGVEAAAVLFGGTAADYAISTIDANPLNINHLTFVDGWGDAQFLYSPASELFSLDTGAPGYNDPSGGPAYSALVMDHGPFEGTGHWVNYAFRIEREVPEPASIAMWGLGALGMMVAVRRRRQAKLKA